MAFAPTDNRVLYVLYDVGDAAAYTRIWRYTINPGPPEVWTAENITDNFPPQRRPIVIAGDGYNSSIAYIGTDKGVWRGVDTGGTWNWQPYNKGLPLVEVKDLLVDASSKELRAATFGRGVWATITGP